MKENVPKVVGDWMTTDVVSLTEEQDLRFLEDIMRVMRFRHMPVVDEDRLVGLISHRDVLRISASSLLPAARESSEYLQKRFKVRDVMQRDVNAIPPTMLLKDAARLMVTEKLGCLPIVDEHNCLLGIITESDIVRLAMELLED